MSAVQGSSDVVQQQCVTRIFRCTTAAVGLGARIWVAGDAGVHAAQKLPLPTSSSTAAQIAVGRPTKVRHGSGAVRGHCSKHMASMPALTLTLVKGVEGPSCHHLRPRMSRSRTSARACGQALPAFGAVWDTCCF